MTPEQAAAAGLPAVALSQVTQVVVGSPADRAGVRAGDVIVEADGTVDPSSEQVKQAVADGHALLRVRRRNGMFYAALKK